MMLVWLTERMASPGILNNLWCYLQNVRIVPNATSSSRRSTCNVIFGPVLTFKCLVKYVKCHRWRCRKDDQWSQLTFLLSFHKRYLFLKGNIGEHCRQVAFIMELASNTDFRHVFQLQVPNQRRSYRLNHLQKGKMTDMLKRLLQFSKGSPAPEMFFRFRRNRQERPLVWYTL